MASTGEPGVWGTPSLEAHVESRARAQGECATRTHYITVPALTSDPMGCSVQKGRRELEIR